MQYVVHSTWYVVRGTQYVVCSMWYVVHGTQYVVCSTWYVVLITWYVLLGTQYVVRSTQYVVRSKCKLASSETSRGRLDTPCLTGLLFKYLLSILGYITLLRIYSSILGTVYLLHNKGNAQEVMKFNPSITPQGGQGGYAKC